MFNKLVESGSHDSETKRSVWFLGGTALSYFVLLTVAFVLSVLSLDANVDAADLYEDSLVSPVPVMVEVSPPPPNSVQPPKEGQKPFTPQQVTEAIAPVYAPLIPKTLGTKASPIPPVTGRYKYGPTNLPPGPGPTGPGNGPGGTGKDTVGPIVVKIEPPPVPPPTPKPLPRAPVSGGVMNGSAINPPKPVYPKMAHDAHAAGTVIVHVDIDEQGRVTGAYVVSGHPLLRAAALEAAKRTKFKPTTLSGQPVKVTGVMTYNFVAQ